MKELAEILNVSESEAKRRWWDTKLDGDERFSIGSRLGLPFNETIGQNGVLEYKRGIEKLKHGNRS